jgi:hypothetical protein
VTLGVQLDTVRNVALAGVVVAAVLAVVVALVVKAVVSKLLLIAVLVLAGIVLWANRQNLTDCAAKVERSATGGPTATCHFLWFDVDVA